MDDSLSIELYGEEVTSVTNGGKSMRHYEDVLRDAKQLPLDERARFVADLIPGAMEFSPQNVTINFGTNITNNHTSDSVLFQLGTSAEELAKQLEPFTQEDLSKLIEAIAIRMRRDAGDRTP